MNTTENTVIKGKKSVDETSKLRKPGKVEIKNPDAGFSKENK